MVEGKLRRQWSPEQIADWLGRSEGISLSHERIYQHIRSDQAEGCTLHTHLRQRLGSKRSTAKSAYKGSIPDRVSIDERTPIVEEKQRIGDWEVDLMMGCQGGGALLTVVERKSRFTRIAPVESKHADHVAEVLIDTLQDLKTNVQTLTMDNGNEFAQHQKVSKALQADVYFAHPYCAWERGLSENTNGLLRQYFPKSIHFKTFRPTKIQLAEMRLNDRPRKGLGFRTPNEIFHNEKS